MKMYGAADVQLHTFLLLALDRGEWSVSRSQPLYPWRKSPQCPLDRRLGGPQNWSKCGGKEKTSFHCPSQESNPTKQPVA